MRGPQLCNGQVAPWLPQRRKTQPAAGCGYRQAGGAGMAAVGGGNGKATGDCSASGLRSNHGSVRIFNGRFRSRWTRAGATSEPSRRRQSGARHGRLATWCFLTAEWCGHGRGQPPTPASGPQHLVVRQGACHNILWLSRTFLRTSRPISDILSKERQLPSTHTVEQPGDDCYSICLLILGQ